MPPLSIKREEVNKPLGFPTSASKPSTSHQNSGKNGPASIHTTAPSQSHQGTTTTQPSGQRLGRKTSRIGGMDHVSDTLKAQQRRQLGPLRDILRHTANPNGNVKSRTNPPKRPNGPLPTPSSHTTAPSLQQTAGTPRVQMKQESPLRVVIEKGPVRQPVIKREPEHFPNSWRDFTPQDARRFFQPVFGRTTLLQAREARHSRPSSRARHRNWTYNDLDRPSEDALGPQHHLRYSESPRTPKHIHIKDEPLDDHTPDVKAQVNPWVQYAGPSPFSLLPNTALLKTIKQEPHSASRNMFNSQQRKRELSSDEDEPLVRGTKRLKRAGGFQYQPSQDGTKHEAAAYVDDGVDEGEIRDIPGHETY